MRTVLNSSILDSGICKYFCLAQLGLQYLSFCKDFLDKTVTSLRKNVYNCEKEKHKLLKTYKKQNEELLRMHKRIQRNEISEKDSAIYSCSKCTKNFITSDLLDKHLERKHPQCLHDINSDKNLVANVKLELEIKQLKQKLNDAEKELQEHCKESQRKASYASMGIQTNFEEEKDKDESNSEMQSHRQLILDSQYQLADLLKAQLNAMDEWKTTEKQRYQKESQDIKYTLQEALNLMSQKKCVVLNRTKLDLFSVPAGNQPNNEINEQIVNEWKKKYNDLESYYKDSNDKLKHLLDDLDKQNKEKALLIDNLKKKPKMKDFTTQVDIKIHKDLVSKDITPIPEELPEDLTKLSLESPKSSTSNLIKLIKRKGFLDDTESEDEIATPLSQPKANTKELPKAVAVNKIDNVFRSAGIKPNQKTLSSDDFKKIKNSIARDRNSKISKFHNFLSVRNRIVRRLEDLVDIKLDSKLQDTSRLEKKSSIPILKLDYEGKTESRKNSYLQVPQKKVNFEEGNFIGRRKKLYQSSDSE